MTTTLTTILTILLAAPAGLLGVLSVVILRRVKPASAAPGSRRASIEAA